MAFWELARMLTPLSARKTFHAHSAVLGENREHDSGEAPHDGSKERWLGKTLFIKEFDVWNQKLKRQLF